VGALLLVGITRVCREGMIEGLAIGCACTEAGRSLLEPYGMASPRQPDRAQGSPPILKKAAADIAQAA